MKLKHLLFAWLFILAGCCKVEKAPSDNSVLEKLAKEEYFSIFSMYGEFDLYRKNEGIVYQGKGSSLEKAYKDSLKHRSMECKLP